MKKNRWLLGGLCTLLASGCVGTSPVSDSSSSSVVQSAQLDDLAAARSGWAMYNQIRQPQENTLFSPLSAWLALGMLEEGVQGSTQKEIAELLGQSPSVMASQAESWMASQGEEICLVNGLWVNNTAGENLNPNYIAVMEKEFKANIFSTPNDARALKMINDWIKEKTDGQIPFILDSLDKYALLALFNVLVFEGTWETEIPEKDIEAASFFDVDGQESEVRMMRAGFGSYVQTEELEGFRLPYDNPRYQLAMLVPKEGKQLEQALDTLKIDQLMKDLCDQENQPVTAVFPAYEAFEEIDLQPVLEACGVQEIFGNGDFSPMQGPSDWKLKVSRILQKTKIEVNAKGTRAAAASAVEVVQEKASVEEGKVVRCDRPFLYVLYDRDNQMPLFFGSMQKMKK